MDLIDLTKKEMEGWLESLTFAQLSRLVVMLVDLLRGAPRASQNTESK